MATKLVFAEQVFTDLLWALAENSAQTTKSSENRPNENSTIKGKNRFAVGGVTGGDPAAMAVLQNLMDTGAEYYRQQTLAIREGRMDFNSHQTKKQCSEKGIHCWTPPTQRFGIGGTGGWHDQSCLLCGAIGRRNGKRKRTETDGGEVCLSKARKAKNALRRCFKMICLLKWWTKATYAPPSSGGASYRRLEQEAMATGMDRSQW